MIEIFIDLNIYFSKFIVSFFFFFFFFSILQINNIDTTEKHDITQINRE